MGRIVVFLLLAFLHSVNVLNAQISKDDFEILFYAIENNETQKIAEYGNKVYEFTEDDPFWETETGIYLLNVIAKASEKINIDKAEIYYKRLLPLLERNFGKEHPNYGTVLNNMAELYYSMGQYDKALLMLEEVLENTEKSLGKEHPDYGISLNNLAELYRSMGAYDKALPLYIEALENVQKNLGKEHPNYGLSLNNLALLYNDMGQYNKALPMYIAALEITEKSLGKEHPNYGLSLNNLALLYYSMGQYDKALPFYLEALENTERSLGKEHPDYGISLNNLAVLYHDMGEYDKALPLYVEALENTERSFGKKHPDYGIRVSNLAGLYNDMGQYNEALPLYLEALENTERSLGKKRPDYGIRLSNLAQLHHSMGQYDKALPLYLEALENAEKSLGKEHPDYGIRLSNLAVLYYGLGQYHKALPLYLEALENAEKSLGKEHPSYGIRLNNLAGLHSSMGKYDKALSLYLEALENAEKNLGKEHPDYGSHLNNLAGLHSSMGEYDKALPLYLEALENAEKSLGKEHPSYGIRLNNLAGLHSSMGKYDKALSLYLEALENAEKSLEKEHPDYGIRLSNLAQLHHSMGQYDKTLPLLEEALENIKRQIGQVFDIFSENEKEFFLKTINNNFNFYQSFYFDYYPTDNSVSKTAFDIELLTKNLILSSTENMRKTIENSSNPEILDIYNEWFVKKASIAKQYELPISERSEGLKTMENEAENLERQLVQYSKEFEEVNQIGKISWEDIQKNLKPNEVAIEFSSFQFINNAEWTDTIQYMALVLKKEDKQPKLVPLFTQDELDKLLDKNEKTKDKINGLYSQSSELYNLVWKPLEQYIKEGETIYFAPSGLLHQIAFSAITSPDGIYLSDKYTLKQLSTTAKILNPAESFKVKDIALFGGINYDESIDQLAIASKIIRGKDSFISRSLYTDVGRGEVFGFLPGTLNEVKEIKKLAEKNQIKVDYFTDNDALEEQFKALHGKNSPQILHIATHGFFFPDPEKNLKGLDGMQLMGRQQSVFKLSDNPLNRSGLLFAGANHTWNGEETPEGVDDGILTAYEASNVSLPNTELVVLSACDTGLGDINGSEGVYGLQRAFKLAGVKNIIMSLWKVPDEQTSEMFQLFYQELLNGKSIHQSFVEAQTKMKEKYSPYYWAGFVLLE